MLTAYTISLWASAITDYNLSNVYEDSLQLATEVLVFHLMNEEC